MSPSSPFTDQHWEKSSHFLRVTQPQSPGSQDSHSGLSAKPVLSPEDPAAFRLNLRNRQNSPMASGIKTVVTLLGRSGGQREGARGLLVYSLTWGVIIQVSGEVSGWLSQLSQLSQPLILALVLISQVRARSKVLH